MQYEDIGFDSDESIDFFDRYKEYGGIGRLTYFLSFLGVGILSSIVETARIVNSASFVFSIVILGVLIILTILRLQNIGRSRWWSVLLPIPIIGFFIVILPCLVCQEGYEETKVLDRTGSVINVVLFCVLIALAVLLIAGLVLQYFLL